MTPMAYWIDEATALPPTSGATTQRPSGRERLRAALSGALGVARGLIEANWNHPPTSRTWDRLDQRKAKNHAGYATNEVAARAFTTGLQSLQHSNLRRAAFVASFPTQVKVAAARDGDWCLATGQVIELHPEDQVDGWQ